jgi:hypothetical protein
VHQSNTRRLSRFPYSGSANVVVKSALSKSKMFVNCKGYIENAEWKTMRYSENATNASIVISRDIRICNIFVTIFPAWRSLGRQRKAR